MKATIEDLQDSFKIGYEVFEDSRKEANEVWDLYHNRHYTEEQLNILRTRGQPAETFNVIKAFSRMLVGYYSTIVNTITVQPRNPRDIDTCTLLNDTINYVFEDNRFDIEGDQIKLGGLVSGLLCSFCNVTDTGMKDPFGRPIYSVVTHHVADNELILDPNSVLDNYSDATFLHRFRWFSEDKVVKLFGKAAKDKLEAYYNHLNIDEAEFTHTYNTEFTGRYKVFNNYLVVHTVLEDENNKRWSIFWSGETILRKDEITYKKTKWPYRVQKLHSSNKAEYYGIFRDVIESQKAIDQAILKIQLMLNSEKAYVEENAVESVDAFRIAFNRVNSVIPVKNISGIRVENMSAEVQDQYIIVDRALDRIQRVLGINDSFLGMAFASDSGRKVKLQQNQTVMSLRYLSARINSFYRSLGEDIAYLVQQYYKAYQILAVSDEIVGQRWIELNRPMTKPTGALGANGEPEQEPIMLPEYDPASGDMLEDEEGNIILAPVSEPGSDFSFTEFQIRIEATAYNDEDEKAQLMLESVMSGQIGQLLASVNPAGFFQVAALAMKSMKTKYTPNIVQILEQTAAGLGQNPQATQEASAMAQGQTPTQAPMSRQLKLPTNTNEGYE
jgi:ACT domain-containing protein